MDDEQCKGCCRPRARVGDVVENFKLEAYHGDETRLVSLSDYKGKWVVLLFYPADFTFVCPTELSEAADMYEQFQKENAEILSVSTDTVFAHKAWHDTSDTIKKIKYPMLADPNGRLCRYFGTYIKGRMHDVQEPPVEDQGLSLRGTFIIDPKGVLKSADIHDNSIGRNAKEILRKLQAAKFTEEHQGMVCPASWTPGGETLKPGLDLVGK
ncbi:MAG: redoxin domain-containing protein, partial [DPANN group archaeon]|nr:redoxin domain-containing protein [DPANN group archaeon]